MAEQRTFAGLAWSKKGKVTRRERFLGEMNAVIPWARLVALIEPHYPKAGRGRHPHDLERMLRIYFLQQWFDLSDPAAEDAIYDSESMRRFAGVELGEDKVPDETTILHAPSSTKNASKSRDPEMRQTKKGNTWYFGMKVHVGTDKRGVVHSLVTTHAAEADIHQLPDLMHGEERELYGDKAYGCEGDRQAYQEAGIRYRVTRRGSSKQPVSEYWKEINRSRSRVRAFVEHPFLVVKRLWGFDKVRYRGLAKNTARAYAAFALANLYLLRKRLMPPGATCAL
jgi:IS5 family transposase